MVGIGTSDVNLDKYRHTFCSLLGKDTDSWGLSYTGKLQTPFHWCCILQIPYNMLVQLLWGSIIMQLLPVHSVLRARIKCGFIWVAVKFQKRKTLLLVCLLPGLLHHKGDKMNFSSRFGQGSIIGVHLDTWHGTLTFFKNRKCIGESHRPH